MSDQGGEGASVRYINLSENRSAGRLMRLRVVGSSPIARLTT